MRFWVAYGALALSVALLAPALVPLSGSMDSFADDLANGTFRPFGGLGQGKGPIGAYAGALGGLTGDSTGNYLPGSNDIPKSFPLDRDGHGGVVTIDYVFNPELGAMKRLKSFDGIAPDGETLVSLDTTLKPVAYDPTLRYDRVIQGSFAVSFHPNVAIPIYSPHPKAIVESYRVDPPLQDGVQVFKDGADTFYALGHVEKLATLNITYRVSSDYYVFTPPSGARVSDYRLAPRAVPALPPQLKEDAKLVLARAGVSDSTDVGATLDALTVYFRSFTEGDIPPPGEIDSLYLALALGEHGCCRHRAFAFMVTAQAVGIPTRVIVNEAHAFVEVMLPDGHWHQINLGGCGSYRINNPNNYPDMFPEASSPRTTANPDEARPAQRVATVTNITEAPTRIVKGQVYYVNGTVLTTSGQGVPGARVDVYLNETKDSMGRLTGAGTAGPDGRFSIPARVPADAPAKGYQLVARGSDGQQTAGIRFQESWSDPEVDVFAPTQIAFPTIRGAANFPVNITGRLSDLDGHGVANATLHWTTGGQPQPDARTDALGRFVARVTYAAEGGHTATFSFDGNEHYGAVAQQVTVSIGSGAITLPSEPVALARGEPGSLSGRVAIAGVDLAGRDIQSVSSGPGLSRAGKLQADGSFLVLTTPAATTPPGVYTISWLVPSLSLNATQSVRIAARPVMTLDVPMSVAPRDAFVIHATLASDNGTAVASGVVDLLVDGNVTRTLLTNRTGVARFEMPPGSLQQGDHRVSVVFAGDRDLLEGRADGALRVAQAWYASLPLWTYVAAIVVLLAAGILVPILTTTRARRALARLVPTAAIPERRFLALAFPDHPPGVPPVYEPGERALVRVVARDREGKALSVRVLLDVAGARLTGRTDGEAGTHFEVPLQVTTRARVTAVGLARMWTRPIDVLLPVASYREAVERGFVALRERSRASRATTAGELVEQLSPRLDETSRRDLARAAALFDVADYSPARVDRAFYHSFARAVASLPEVASDADGR